jgi:hypothetical protein
MEMPWGNLFGKQKKYDKDGNEIDDQGNIVAPALGVQAPAGGGLQMPSSMGDYVAQIAPDAASSGGGAGGVLSGALSGAATGSSFGPWGTGAGAVLGAVGSGINAKGEEDKAAEEHTQKVRDAQAEQQRMDQLLNYKRGQDTQKVGFEGLDFLSREADRARLASMGVGYRNAMSRALGY